MYTKQNENKTLLEIKIIEMILARATFWVTGILILLICWGKKSLHSVLEKKPKKSGKLNKHFCHPTLLNPAQDSIEPSPPHPHRKR